MGAQSSHYFFHNPSKPHKNQSMDAAAVMPPE